MKCRNDCGADVTGRQKFCSDRCRKQFKRNSDKLGQNNGLEHKSDKFTLTQEHPLGSRRINSEGVLEVYIHKVKAVPLPRNFGLPDCECKHCQQNATTVYKFEINHGAWKPASQLGKNEFNRVSLPGDVDYVGVAV